MGNKTLEEVSKEHFSKEKSRRKNVSEEEFSG